jgi:chloride channel protein, CIC family
MSVAEVMAEMSVSGEDELPNDLVRTMPDVFTYADEPCRAAAEQMAMTGIMSIPVLDRATGRVRGIVSVHELLAGRKRAVVRESERMRVFGVFAKMSRSFVEDSTE